MYQNQIQEDFLSDFDIPVSGKGKFFQKPCLSVHDDVRDVAKEEKTMKLNKDEFMKQFDDNEVDFDCDLCAEKQSFLYEKLSFAIEKSRDFLTSETEKQRWLDFVSFVEGVVKNVGIVVFDLPKYEEELQVVSSICIFFYGGSWVRLASLIASAEIFDTWQVLKTSYEVLYKFMCAEELDDYEDVTPTQLTETFKNIGFQVALLLSIVHCDPWAEICVTLAFATKLSPMVRLEDFFDGGKSAQDVFWTAADVEWFALLSSITCFVVSFILLGVWPRLVFATYMAFIGMQLYLRGRYRLCLPTGSFTSKPYVFLKSEDFKDSSYQFSIWVSITFSALWQAYYSYDGVCQHLSWLMFLLPAVKFFNLISSYFTYDASSLNLQ